MSKVLFYVILKPLSLLPLWALHLFSNFLFFMIYRVFGYRKEVVKTNIKNAFPEYSEEQVNEVSKKFFKHLCDLIVESIKLFSISNKEAQKRVKTINPEVLDKYFDQGRDIVLTGAHYNNWEMFAVTVNNQIKHKPYGIYFPLKNEFINKKMKESRSKFGLNMISAKEVKPTFEKKEEPKLVIFATDQSPSNTRKAYWMEFLNQDTGVLFGAEKYAKDYNCVVASGKMVKIKRGYYEITYSILHDDVTDLKYGQITESHTRFNEKIIKSKPEFWLWSHKRWKHKRPEGKLIQDER